MAKCRSVTTSLFAGHLRSELVSLWTCPHSIRNLLFRAGRLLGPTRRKSRRFRSRLFLAEAERLIYAVVQFGLTVIVSRDEKKKAGNPVFETKVVCSLSQPSTRFSNQAERLLRNAQHKKFQLWKWNSAELTVWASVKGSFLTTWMPMKRAASVKASWEHDFRSILGEFRAPALTYSVP